MNDINTNKKLAYSIEEAAAASSLSAAKIRKDIRNGLLKSTKKGTRRLILQKELERYLADNS